MNTIQKSDISHIPPFEIFETIRDEYANDKVEKEMVSEALGVQGVVDLHTLYAGGTQPAGG